QGSGPRYMKAHVLRESPLAPIMSLDLPGGPETPVTSVEPLIAQLKSAEKPRSRHLLGLEHEKLVYPRTGPAVPVSYEGQAGIGALLEALAHRGGTLFRESGAQPGIAVLRGTQTLSLEPGGQLELSGAPASTARTVHAENVAHLSETVAE